MAEKRINESDKTTVNCLSVMCEALEAIENAAHQRLSDKMSTGRMSAVARELRELIKVVAACGY